MALEYTKEIVLVTLFSIASRVVIGSFILDACKRMQFITYIECQRALGLHFLLDPQSRKLLEYLKSIYLYVYSALFLL